MQNEVIAKIDALLKMSESNANLSTMNVELREIECSIKEKKFELKQLMATISDDKYFDASSEIVDKNLEISLTKKLKALNKSLRDIDAQLVEIQSEEESAYSTIASLESTIKTSEEYIEVLNTKISSANSDNVAIFKPLLKEAESKLKSDQKYLDKQLKMYEKVQNKMALLSYSKQEVLDKISSEKEKLEDVKSNLLNKRSYVNADLKREDQDRIDNLESQIKDLEIQKTELLSDPVMIAEAAKNYLLDDDKTSALLKIKELRNKILEIPYMNVDDRSSNETLEIELENAESKRDEFASMINSKNYESVDATLINDRIAYVNDKKERYLNAIEELKEKINRNDTILLNDLNNRISYCESEVDVLRDKIDEYTETLESNMISNSKKSSLKASYNKKQEELNNIVELLNLYKLDRQNLIMESYKLENEDIAKYKNLIDSIDEEIKHLEKQCISANKVKDFIAIENDKKTLKELTDVVKAIKKRLSFKSTPNEIYDEVEILLGTTRVMDDELDLDEDISDIDFSDIELSIPGLEIEETDNESIDDYEMSDLSDISDEIEETNLEEEEMTSFEDVDIDDIPSDIDYNIPDLEEISVDELDDIVVSLDEDKSEVLDNEEIIADVLDIDSLPVVDEEEIAETVNDVEEVEEQIKVVDVEKLDDNEEKIGNEFLIGDYNAEV